MSQSPFSVPFTIAGPDGQTWKFLLRPLPPMVYMDHMGAVSQLIPLLALAKAQDARANRAMAGAFDRLTPFIKLFRTQCIVNTGHEVKVDSELDAVFDTIFIRRHWQMQQWVLQCIFLEFQDF